MLEFILFAVGLVASIAGWPWLKGPIDNATRKARVLRVIASLKLKGLPAPLGEALAMRSGNATNSTNDLEMVDWRHEIVTDNEGNGRISADCIVANMQDKLVTEIRFPFWVDYCEECHDNHLNSVHCWARIGRVSYELTPEIWDANERIGFVRIPFPTPLKSNGSLRIHWGYYLPHLYGHEGSHWFEWYAGRPHSRFAFVLKLNDGWQADNVRSSSIPESANVPTPTVRGTTIYFSVKSPRAAHKYRIDFHLSRRPPRVQML
jgi:hypothetical protein